MQFGANSPAVMSWAAAQDKVFANCDQSDPQNPILPDPADASLPLIIRKDRDYQFAAAYFYARGYAEAKKRFLAIAADSQSPWRAISAMVAARCDIRSAMLDTDDALERKQKLTTAADQLRKVIANPSMIAARSAADALRSNTWPIGSIRPRAPSKSPTPLSRMPRRRISATNWTITTA